MRHVAGTAIVASLVVLTACRDITEPAPMRTEPAQPEQALLAETIEQADDTGDITDALDRIAGSFADSPATARLRAALRRLEQDARSDDSPRMRQALRLADDAVAALEEDDDAGIAAELDAIRLVLDGRR